MKKLTIEELEKMMQTKYVCTIKIKLSDKAFGDDKKRMLEFDILDGFAYCGDFEGKEYYMIYPRKKFIEDSKTMNKEVREYLELDEHEPITELHSMESYMTLSINK